VPNLTISYKIAIVSSVLVFSNSEMILPISAILSSELELIHSFMRSFILLVISTLIFSYRLSTIDSSFGGTLEAKLFQKSSRNVGFISHHIIGRSSFNGSSSSHNSFFGFPNFGRSRIGTFFGLCHGFVLSSHE
jgi:hypothetical protein